MNSPHTGRPMFIVTLPPKKVTYNDFIFSVELDSYYCEDSDEYFTDDYIDQKNQESLEGMWESVMMLRRETGCSLIEIQRIYDLNKSLSLAKFKKYYKSYGPKF